MNKTSLKALYIFLTSWLGVILVLMLHRAVFVLYELLLTFFPDIFAFGADRTIIEVLDFFTMLLAVFFGGWYGVWLGLHWFEKVYEEDGVHHNAIFYGFLPHNVRREYARYRADKKKAKSLKVKNTETKKDDTKSDAKSIEQAKAVAVEPIAQKNQSSISKTLSVDNQNSNKVLLGAAKSKSKLFGFFSRKQKPELSNPSKTWKLDELMNKSIAQKPLDLTIAPSVKSESKSSAKKRVVKKRVVKKTASKKTLDKPAAKKAVRKSAAKKSATKKATSKSRISKTKQAAEA
ncbi:MAG: hypothetical protein R3B41_03480 [Candidatus Doudnabacteria bacterium]